MRVTLTNIRTVTCQWLSLPSLGCRPRADFHRSAKNNEFPNHTSSNLNYALLQSGGVYDISSSGICTVPCVRSVELRERTTNVLSSPHDHDEAHDLACTRRSIRAFRAYAISREFLLRARPSSTFDAQPRIPSAILTASSARFLCGAHRIHPVFVCKSSAKPVTTGTWYASRRRRTPRPWPSVWVPTGRDQ